MLLVVAVVFLAALAMDLARSPERQLSARLLVIGVRAYQHIGHQLVPRGQCRFSPTCSSYAEVVIRERGALEGGWLTARRLIRCGPWTPVGTKDPPPMAQDGLLSPGKAMGGEPGTQLCTRRIKLEPGTQSAFY